MQAQNKKFKYLFGNVPPVSALNFARLAVMKHFGWKRVAIIQENRAASCKVR